MDLKTVRYAGSTGDDVQRQYATDSAEAIAAGWLVQNASWEQAAQPTLSVTYKRSGATSQSTQARSYETEPRRSAGRTVARTLYLVVLAAVTVVVAVIAVALVLNNEAPLSCVFGGC